MTAQKLLLAGLVFTIFSCNKTLDKKTNSTVNSTDVELSKEDPRHFSEIGSIDLGDEGAAEITAYDPLTKKLFVVNNSGDINKIDVVDLSNPSLPVYITSINVAPFGGLVNSLVSGRGFLAAAIEATDKVSPGKVVVFAADDYAVIKEIPVGSLPDMVAVSDDGNYLVTANEGEPNNYNDAGSIDPVGSVSIITVHDNFSVVTLDFSSFASQRKALEAKGFRIYGPNASFAQDIEPEYVAISPDSKTAWVTLQENNGIAKVDLDAKKITDIFPLGFKNFNRPRNAFDPSDEDGGYFPATWNVRGMYEPDGIIALDLDGVPYLFTANEGDTRDYDGFSEEIRVGDDNYVLDPVAFPDAATLKLNENLGRLTVTNTLGDFDNDGDYDAIFVPGARSFSIWNGLNGNLLYDCGNEMEVQTSLAGLYDDTRSDNKGVEPEGMEKGRVGGRQLIFVGMERADAVAVYDITNPPKPVLYQILHSGDAPEGILFVSKQQSPNNRSLLIVSSEDDGVVKIFAPESL